jgi:hypothetical protein
MAMVEEISATYTSARDRMVRFLEWPYFFLSEATVEDRVSGTSCLTECEIEDLTRGKLSHDNEQRCLAHLLWCDSCQQRVNEEVEFAQAVRAAATLLEQQESAVAPQSQPAGWLQRGSDRFRDWFRDLSAARFPSRWTAVALSVCALTVMAVLVPLRRASEVDVVVLRSERGSAVAATVESDTGASLRLRIDVSDVVPYTAYTVTVVDAMGRTIETSAVSATLGSASITLHRHLAAGGYWIRLSAPDGRLLREYALRVRS